VQDGFRDASTCAGEGRTFAGGGTRNKIASDGGRKEWVASCRSVANGI